MGVGSVVVNLGARALALLGYTALYAVTPLRLDPHDWWTWVLALLLVDLLWYAYHRSSHRIRVLWARHQAHHDRNYGGVLIVWDRLFGTFREEQQRPTYGLTHPVTTFNPFRLQ
jgi:sterol desaturase/sphingolipid hydroxylase (fatty acid hydroxylase superfamily)